MAFRIFWLLDIFDEVERLQTPFHVEVWYQTARFYCTEMTHVENCETSIVSYCQNCF